MLMSEPLDIKREACSTLANAARGGSPTQIVHLVQCEAPLAMLDAMFMRSSAIFQVALLGFNAVIDMATGTHASHFRGLDVVQVAVLDCLERNETLETVCSDMRRPIGDGLVRALFVLQRARMTEICIALQALGLPALVTVIILDRTSEATASTALHQKWKLVTKVKHFEKK
jgi:hypothetical protein